MEPELKLYTIADLRSWLIDNNPPAGLSEQVIAPVRAYAILNNPYVKDEDAVVAAIYEGDELAAFTASFPDMYEGKRIWWATTLWCNPKYQGQGYGMIVVGSLMEAHELELTFDRWGAQETVEIFKCLGYHTAFHNRYILGDKSIDRSSFKGKLAYCVQELQKLIHHIPYTIHHTPYTVHRTPYTLKYSTFVDGEAYAFMQSHRGNDLFFREQKMINWILQYPFLQGITLPEMVENDIMFSSNISSFGYMVVKVYSQDRELCGVYILRRKSDRLGVIAIYYNDVMCVVVFDSIVAHIRTMGHRGFETELQELKEYIQSYIYFPRCITEQVSLSIPDGIEFPDGYTLQFMDGDSFC